MGGSSPVVDPKGNVYVASADGYNLGAGQPYDDSDAVLELSPAMHLESIFYLNYWQQLSGGDLDLGTGDPVLVDGFVFQVGKTDNAYLLHQGALGGQEGEFASMPLCSGDPDGWRAVDGSVVYVPSNVIHSAEATPEADVVFFTVKDASHSLHGTKAA